MNDPVIAVSTELAASRSSKPPTVSRRQLLGEALAVGLAMTLLYALTGARDLQWGDPAKLSLFVRDFVLSASQEGHAGLILWSWPFSLLPIEPYALRLHLSSAITLGMALGVAYATLRAVGISRSGGLIGIAALGVAHTIWFTGTMFESYPLVLLILAVALWLLVTARRCLLAGLLLGLGVAVHPLTVFGFLGIGFGVWRSAAGLRGLTLLVAGAGAGVLLPVVVSFVMNPGAGLLSGVNWGTATSMYAGLSYPKRNIPLMIGYAIYNFASPALLLLAIGWVRIPRPWRIAFLLFAIPHYLVAAFWLPQRSYLIPIPVYLIMAWPIALGAERLLATRGRAFSWATLLLVLTMPVVAYQIAPTFFARSGLDRTIRDAPYRQEATYFLQPWKVGEYTARNYLRDLGRALPDGSVAVGDWVLQTTVIAAQRIAEWRTDVTVINAISAECEAVAEHLARGVRVFVLDDEPGYLPDCLLDQGRLVAVTSVESLSELVPPVKPSLEPIFQAGGTLP